MRLEVCGVDHQLAGLAAFGRQGGEDLVEYTQPAPPDEAVIDRLVWSIVFGGVAPPQAVPDHENNAADYPSVIHAGNPMGKWKIRLNPAHLCLGKQK